MICNAMVRMVWCPENFDNFVIVDQDGDVLTRGRLDGAHDLPPLRERQMVCTFKSWRLVYNNDTVLPTYLLVK